MTPELALNIVLVVTVLTVIISLMSWAIATAHRDASTDSSRMPQSRHSPPAAPAWPPVVPARAAAPREYIGA